MIPSTPRRITLAPLIGLPVELQIKVRDIRNEEGVRKWMYSDHVIDVNEHLAWLDHLKVDDRQIVFCVLDELNAPLGVVSVNAIDRKHQRADWAYYLTSDARGGLGSAIEYSFLNFVFDVVGIQKLNCEVVSGNDAVVKLHKKFLFQEEGVRRANVIKDGRRVDVYFLGVTKEEWDAGRLGVYQKYCGVLDKFSVSILWKGEQEKGPASPIDQIEAARARNNLNWMNILRLAIEKSPGTAKPIVSEIRRIDREISDLTQKIIDSPCDRQAGDADQGR